jgi:hypothetical protein
VDPYRRAGTSPSFTVDLDLHWLQAGRGQQDPTARPTTPELASPGKELKTVPCSASRCSPSTLKDPYVSSTCARSSDGRPSLGWAANMSTPTMTEDRSSRADCRWRWESQPRHPATELFHTPGQRTLGAMTAGRLALRRWRDLAQPDCPLVQSFTHGYAGTHEEACGAVGSHLVCDRRGGRRPTRLLWLVVSELRRWGDDRRHGGGRTPELSGGQPQGQLPTAAALELSLTQLG